MLLRIAALSCLAFFICVNFSFAQTTNVPPVKPLGRKVWKTGKKIQNESLTPAEKSIAVDAKVNVSLCVSEGKLKVNGWERGEIRAFVSGGSAVGFKIQQSGAPNKPPVWVMVLGFDPAKNKEPDADECLSGDEIELDVPRGAIVNVKSRESETTIKSVRRVTVTNVGGDIFLSNIAQGVEAETFEGDVTIENSGGALSLASTTGNITAFDVNPSEIGDVFKAKTVSGAIVLQQIGHRQAEANSNSGSIKFVGEFQSGGQYILGTQNGSISLSLPEKSSCKITASYGFGAFNSELKLKNISEGGASKGKAQSLTALLGGGDANLSLTTYSGAIRIKKL